MHTRFLMKAVGGQIEGKTRPGTGATEGCWVLVLVWVWVWVLWGLPPSFRAVVHLLRQVEVLGSVAIAQPASPSLVHPWGPGWGIGRLGASLMACKAAKGPQL